jgi:NAD(P)H-flavin reductase
MALETNCLTDGCVYHTYVGARYETDELLQWDMDAVRSTHSSHVEVVVDIPTTLVLTKEQAEEIENLLHNQVELVIAFALQKSRDNMKENDDDCS